MAGRRRSWSDEQLRQAVATSLSVAQTLRAIGLRALGGNYIPVQRRIRELALSTAHWTGQGHLKGRTNPHVPKQPLGKILRRGSTYQSNKLKRRLLGEGVLEAKCSQCRLTKWQGKPVPLELDHIDGDRTNNSLKNLRMICPNCHALTATYRGRNTRYPHIPAIAEIESGIKETGSVTAFARKMDVTPSTVRGWRRSTRLRRQ